MRALGLSLLAVIVVAALGVGRALLPLGFLMHLPLVGILWLANHPGAARATIAGLYFAEYVAYGAGVCALILAMMKLELLDLTGVIKMPTIAMR